MQGKPHTFFNTPVEKNASTGISAITPISPTHRSMLCSTHHNPMVTMHTKVTHHCSTVNFSLVGLIPLISISPSPSGQRSGWYESSRRPQMRMMEMKETGRATPNHDPHPIGDSISPIAIRFWGEEIGELWPPILAARAMASWLSDMWSASTTNMQSKQYKLTMRHGAKADLGGSVRKIGWISVSENVGMANCRKCALGSKWSTV